MNTDTLNTIDIIQQLAICAFMSGFLAFPALSGILVVQIFSLLFGFIAILSYIVIRSKELKRQCNNKET